MRKFFLMLIIIGGLFITGLSLAATCDPPTGTISTDKTTVEAGNPFTITVTGFDDNDIWTLFVCFYDANGDWQCDGQSCWGWWTQKSCTKTWDFVPSEPGVYTFYGTVTDSDDKHGCPKNNETSVGSVEVVVGNVTTPCNSNCMYNMGSCLCGQTPIRGGICCSTWNNGVGKQMTYEECMIQAKCPSVIADNCPGSPCSTKFDGNCLCGGELINRQYCCPSLGTGEKGFYDQEECQEACVVTLPECANKTCQGPESNKCMCGTDTVNPGQFCCAASNSAYPNQNACQADSRCLAAANTCGQLFSTWCQAGLYCSGSDRTSEASDKASHPDQICCAGDCTTTPPPASPTAPPAPTPGAPDAPGSPSAAAGPRTNCPTEGLVPCGTEGCPCQFCDFFVLINNIIELAMTRIVPAFAALMLIFGGVLFFFAGAKPDVVNQAKGIITSVVIGLLIIFAAWVIVNTVLTRSGIINSPSLLKWYEISCPSGSSSATSPSITTTEPPLPPLPPSFN